MPSGVAAEKIPDMLIATHKDFNKNSWADWSLPNQEYFFLSKFMKLKKKRPTSGNLAEFEINVKRGPSMRWVGPYAQSSYAQSNTLKSMNVPMRFGKNYWVWDTIENDLNSMPSTRVVSLSKVRRTNCINEIHAGLETAGWSKPDDETDDMTMWGLRTWLVDSQTQGFNGGNPTGFTSLAGIDWDNTLNGKNYTDKFADVTPDDLVAKMRRAFVYTKFIAPFHKNDIVNGWDYSIYLGWDELDPCERLARAANSQNGFDLANSDGKTLCRGVPLTRVAELESHADDPILFVNWSHMRITAPKGDPIQEKKPTPMGPQQDTVFVANVYVPVNLACLQKRSQAIIVREAA